MNIVLIGMRGSGKTTVGKLVALKTGREFLETDAMIAKKAGMPIAAIVEKYGWEHFRKLESEVVLGVSLLDEKVIATGGGAVLKTENTKALKKNGRLILLTAPVDSLVERIGDDSGRPLLTDNKTMREDIETVAKERKDVYSNAADITIDTVGQSPMDVANRILEYVEIES